MNAVYKDRIAVLEYYPKDGEIKAVFIYKNPKEADWKDMHYWTMGKEEEVIL